MQSDDTVLVYCTSYKKEKTSDDANFSSQLPANGNQYLRS